jgi:hypothetical protein
MIEQGPDDQRLFFFPDALKFAGLLLSHERSGFLAPFCPVLLAHHFGLKLGTLRTAPLRALSPIGLLTAISVSYVREQWNGGAEVP